MIYLLAVSGVTASRPIPGRSFPHWQASMKLMCPMMNSKRKREVVEVLWIGEGVRSLATCGMELALQKLLGDGEWRQRTGKAIVSMIFLIMLLSWKVVIAKITVKSKIM